MATATIGALGEIVSVEIFGDNLVEDILTSILPIPDRHLTHQTAMDGQELDATLEARLGGSLASVNPANNFYPSNDVNRPYPTPNNNPWIEIWDLERDESYIDEQGFRALAVPKVTNGVIEDIVVVKSGKGYRDPVVFVRGGAPEDGPNHGVWHG